MTAPTNAQLVALAKRLGLNVSDRLSGARAIETTYGWIPLPVTPRDALVLAGAIQAAMAGLGWSMTLNVYETGEADCIADCIFLKALVEFGRGESDTSTPDAIALAACAALGVPG